MFNRLISIINAKRAACLAAVASLALSACGGGGASGPNPPPNPNPPPAAASLSMAASPTSIAADDTSTTTITATVLNASNAAVSGVTVNFAASTGALSAGSAVSDASGRASVTFRSGATDSSSRTATVTATTANGITSQVPVRISGSTIELLASSSSIVAGGTPATLAITVKNPAGVGVSGVAVTLTSAGAGGVTLTPASATTDASGKANVAVAGTVAGNVTVTATALGETRTVDFVVGGVTTAFAITAPTEDLVPASINQDVVVTVQAPAPTTQVVFATTLGTFVQSGSNIHTATVSGGTATATFRSPVAGLATVQAYDPGNVTGASDTLRVSVTASALNNVRIALQASPTVVAQDGGLSTLIATVVDAAGNPVGNAPVVFQIINPTGGGESVSPAVATTATTAGSGVSLGQARATFTAGSLPSEASGVKIRARVVGSTPLASTGTAPSSADAAITIGGTAGSVAIGRATVALENSNATAYIMPMSVLVADSNGNPVANATVSLSAWPAAWSTGSGCTPDPDAGFLFQRAIGAPLEFPTSVGGTFLNEDSNESLTLDALEDGRRRFYFRTGELIGGATVPIGPITTPQPTALVPAPTGDGILTPPNSAAGTLPATVVTDASGVATFNLTYTKSSAVWVISRIRASTRVQGTETVGQVEFRLPAIDSDLTPCRLPNSPFRF